MNQNMRIVLAVIVLLAIVGLMIGVDALQRRQLISPGPAGMPPGSVPIYLDKNYITSFVPGDLEKLHIVSFVDADEGKKQEGWLLNDVLEFYLDSASLQSNSIITVSSSSRDKQISLAWSDTENLENMVMFDLSGRGTLKLISKMEEFSTRDEWIQDVDLIEVRTP